MLFPVNHAGTTSYVKTKRKIEKERERARAKIPSLPSYQMQK